MRTRDLIVVAGCLIAFFLTASPSEAQTRTGNVNVSTTHTYSFIPAASGQLLATLSWTNTNANLLMLMTCGTGSNLLTFGIAGGLVDRTARFESGILASNPCVIAVGSARGNSAYRLNVQRTVSQSIQRTLSGFAELEEVPEGHYLGDAARRALEALKPLTQR